MNGIAQKLIFCLSLLSGSLSLAQPVTGTGEDAPYVAMTSELTHGYNSPAIEKDVWLKIFEQQGYVVDVDYGVLFDKRDNETIFEALEKYASTWSGEFEDALDSNQLMYALAHEFKFTFRQAPETGEIYGTSPYFDHEILIGNEIWDFFKAQ